MAARVAPVEVTVPGDKSITHRALILAALADGDSRVRGLLDAADTRSTAAALRALGIDVPGDWSGDVIVRGRGVTGWRAPGEELDCGNSGTTARLLLGALAGCPFEARLTGDASLRGRPMRRVTEPLAAAGARFDGADRLPIRVTGARPLRAIDWASPRASAQVKTAMLLAGVTGRAPVRATEPWLSRDHTERMLRSMGGGVAVAEEDGRTAVSMDPPERLEPLELTVPGDVSSAAFFLGLGALTGSVRVRGVGLNPTRTGALRVLERMGAKIDVAPSPESGGEPIGDVTVRADDLRGTVVAPDEVPALLDEVPLLAVVAARAAGETRFDGVAELRVKESDRVRALSENLRRLGVETEEGPDHLVVRGRAGPLRGRVGSHGDHRIAMAFAVLGAEPDNDIEIDDPGAVAISYPGFWDELRRVRREMGER